MPSLMGRAMTPTGTISGLESFKVSAEKQQTQLFAAFFFFWTVTLKGSLHYDSPLLARPYQQHQMGLT